MICSGIFRYTKLYFKHLVVGSILLGNSISRVLGCVEIEKVPGIITMFLVLSKNPNFSSLITILINNYKLEYQPVKVQ